MANEQSPASVQIYNKAIIAFLSGGFTLLAGFGVDVSAWSTPEFVAGLASVLGAALVYFVPNRSS